MFDKTATDYVIMNSKRSHIIGTQNSQIKVIEGVMGFTFNFHLPLCPNQPFYQIAQQCH